MSRDFRNALAGDCSHPGVQLPDRSFIWPSPGLSVEELPAAKGTQPLASAADLTADTFSSDAELEEFLAFTAERHRDLA